MRQFQPAFFCGLGVCESALLISEELAFKKMFRESTAVDHHKRPLAAPTLRVNRPGRQPFAGSGLAFDQHGGIVGATLSMRSKTPWSALD